MISDNFTRRIALRYLWSKRREAFITIITVISVLGVALGVSVLNITMSIMTGFEHSLREKVVGSAHVIVQHLRGPIPDWEPVQAELQSIPGVAAVSPYTQNQVLLSTRNVSRGVLLQGLLPGSSALNLVESYFTNGTPQDALVRPPMVSIVTPEGEEDLVELPPIVLGQALVRKLRLSIGQPVSVLSPELGSTPFGPAPKFRRFVVSGVYRSGLSGYEEALAYTTIEAAQRFFALGETVTGFELRLEDADSSQKIAQSITDTLNSQSRGGFIATDWTEQNRNLWEAIRLEKKVYFIVLLLLIVLASFTIVSSLVMIVMEKRKDIAILKTLGASSGRIAQIFRMQGAVIGFLGTVLGLIGGLLGAIALREYGFPLPQGIFPEDEVPVRLEPLNFLLSGVAAFVICLLSTLYPARRASSLDPAEILRYE